MRRFFLTSMLAIGCNLAGCVGGIQETMVDPVKAVQSVVGTITTVTKPTDATQQEGPVGTASYAISVSITIDPGQMPDGSADGQGTTAQ